MHAYTMKRYATGDVLSVERGNQNALLTFSIQALIPVLYDVLAKGIM